MANCTNYDCEDSLGEYHENECGIEFIGDFNQAVLLECNHHLTLPADASNGTKIQAEIDAGRAHLITGALFDIEDAQPTLVDSSVPCRPQSITEIKRSGNYNNPNVNSTNDDFHDILLSGKNFGGMIIFECSSNSNGTAQVKLIDAAVSFSGGLSAKTKSKQGYTGKFNWTSFANPKTVATPAGIFD